MSMQSMNSSPARNVSKAAEVPGKVAVPTGGKKMGDNTPKYPPTPGPSNSGFSSSKLIPGKLNVKL